MNEPGPCPVSVRTATSEEVGATGRGSNRHASPDESPKLSRPAGSGAGARAAQRAPWLLRWSNRARRRPASAQHVVRQTKEAARRFASLLDLDTMRRWRAAGDRVGPYRLVHESRPRRHGRCMAGRARRRRLQAQGRAEAAAPHLGCGPRKRMAREREIGALLEHPNIARLYDAGVDQHGRPYIAMEYIDGQPLDMYCRDACTGPAGATETFPRGHTCG